MSSPSHLGPSSALHPDRLLQARRQVIKSYYEEGFNYSKILKGHRSCVNALAFSNTNGQFMASGGDDRAVSLWDLHREELQVASSLSGPTGNIFSLAFSATNQYLYSGGVDSKVYRYNLSDGGSAADAMYAYHEEDVRAVTTHPYMDDVFLTCSEDGRVISHDFRAAHRTRAQSTLHLMVEVTCVQYHPKMEHIFITSDNSGRVCLRDARMAFGTSSQRSQNGVVQKYATTLQEPSSLYSKPTISSVTFDATGTKLCVTPQYFCPTIYSLANEHPLAICTGKFLPDGNLSPEGERSYSNNCTVKHGSFGGPEEEYYAAGSDDFRGYVWKIPTLEKLREECEILNEPEWRGRCTAHTAESAAFVGNRGNRDARYLPVRLERPSFHIRGHQSIVNTALMHPSLPLIATAGIESHVLLHSPKAGVPFSSTALGLTRLDTRRIPDVSVEERAAIRRILIGTAAPSDLGVSEEAATLLLFDEILRTEGGEDGDTLFTNGVNSLSDSDDDEDEGEDESG